MTPSMLRSALEAYLSGARSLPDMVAALRNLGAVPSGKVQARIESLLHEADLALNPRPEASRWPGSVAVVRGLAGELLDSLPASDDTPEVEAILARLACLAGEIERRFGIELVGLAGSTAAASRTVFSDIDVAAIERRETNLADISGATEALRQALHRPVDLVMLDRVEPAFRARFSSNLLPIRAGSA